MEGRSIFRKKSLERVTSPEQEIIPPFVRRLLQRALNGEDLSKTQGMDQSRKIRQITR